MRWLAIPLFLLTAASAPAERSFIVGSFERLRVDGPFDVTVVTGSPNASASGDTPALDQVSVRVDGSTLFVSPGALGVGQQAAMAKITISAPALHAVLVNGGGRVRIAEMRGARVDVVLNGAGALDVRAIQADEANVSLNGTGAVTVGGKAGKARLSSYGAGSIDGGGFTANDATILSQSSGDMRVGVRYTAQIIAAGAGGIGIIGAPECRVSGPGRVDCGAGKLVRR
ncbi:DUF2807 domain-containing protein [Sphingomonas sp. JC676]|uniref:GIN domain-containing protein n=1 Tax=Sphingomonas sp. JC676 TaxID=2768065 RepID=UPI00165781BC|nr:DUF2807 domain-containing protein [Sphingomonas sp. JC676]MBC9034392.1 DUF2807 domain-containing protein [Sphingomonas sp. JC676]